MALSTETKRTAHLHPSDLHALARVATDAAAGVVDLVETMHMNIIPPPKTLGRAADIAPLAYRTIRGATRLIGAGAEITLSQVAELLGRREDSPQRRAMLAVLNGVWGDYLDEIDSPLAVPMAFRYGDSALSPPKRKIAVLVHGLCMSDRGWERGSNGDAHDHGAALARDLGYAPVYLNYNSGLHISTNGKALAVMLEALVDVWPVPVEELVIIGHSLGGLVTRSACFYGDLAGHDWLTPLRALVFLGTPHHGTRLEQRGNMLNVFLDATPYMAPISRLGKRRSAAITDLRYGSLVDEDWAGRDRFAHGPDDRCIVPPPPGVRTYTVAATLGKPNGLPIEKLPGDGLVPLDSALGQHPTADRCLQFDESNSWIGYGMNHLDLMGRVEVYEKIREWLSG